MSSDSSRATSERSWEALSGYPWRGPAAEARSCASIEWEVQGAYGVSSSRRPTVEPSSSTRRTSPVSSGVAPIAITLSTHSHLFERARHADEMRQKLGDGFGHLFYAESS